MKHTPGPWYWISDSLTHRQYDIYSPCGLDERHEHIATINNLPHDRLITRPIERANANARLIAAAPELLDQLSAALTVLELAYAADQSLICTAFEAAPRHGLKTIRAAIKKATGQ